MVLSLVGLPYDILLHILEYFFIPLDPTSPPPDSHHVKLSGRSSDTLGSLSLTCRPFALLSRDIMFRDLRLEHRLCHQDLEILRSIGPHIKRLALESQPEGIKLATILDPLIRLQSLFLTHGFDPEVDPAEYGEIKAYPHLAHLSVDHGVTLCPLLGAFPTLQTLQLSPGRGILSGWPVHPALRRLKLLSLPASFGQAETQMLALSFPGIKEFEARFERVRTEDLNMRWKHAKLRQWLAPILALPISHLTLGYYSTVGYQDDLENTSRMLAQRSVTLESLTWRQYRFTTHIVTKRIADLLVAENKYTWDLWVTEFKVSRGERHAEVVHVKEYQVC